MVILMVVEMQVEIQKGPRGQEKGLGKDLDTEARGLLGEVW